MTGTMKRSTQSVLVPRRGSVTFHLAEERKRLGLTQRQVAELMGVTPGRVSQIENGDLEANEVATLSRYARALGARMRIIFDYGDDLRQIA
ncbi:helix-turn-helix transcriptional regulator [Micromonospora sp. NBC_00821]|uniref:helix-turn-helix domain-containing protein n=1 Tax=Micromonospora sp. NBC_00821 TaxID=2975977 RepID=UPI003FA5B483|nr:helix-turn-helix transcriptional regulator [Micromonospora sp. NBC_00821]